jgi:hypothetical protein
MRPNAREGLLSTPPSLRLEFCERSSLKRFVRAFFVLAYLVTKSSPRSACFQGETPAKLTYAACISTDGVSGVTPHL